MDNTEFDHRLRAVYDAQDIPYAPERWNAIAARLDAHEKKSGAAAPGTAGAAVRKSIPLYRVLATSAAACLVALLIWKGAGQDAKTPPVAATETFPTPVNQLEQTTVQAAPSLAEEEGGTFLSHTGPYGAVTPAAQGLITTSVVPAPATPGQHNTDSTPTTAALPGINTFAAAPPQERGSFTIAPEPGPDPYDQRASRSAKTTFGINGGYNIGKARNNFTVGVSVAKPINDRLSLETAVSYVQGGYSAYRADQGTASAGVAVANVQDYQQVSGNLAYLQAAPTLNYRLVRGLSAGGGIDAQRLLNSPGGRADVLYDASGNPAPSGAAWDFGVLARADVTLAKNVRAGVLYRKSVKSATPGGLDADRRNYLLVQLSLRVF